MRILSIVLISISLILGACSKAKKTANRGADGEGPQKGQSTLEMSATGVFEVDRTSQDVLHIKESMSVFSQAKVDSKTYTCTWAPEAFAKDEMYSYDLQGSVMKITNIRTNKDYIFNRASEENQNDPFVGEWKGLEEVRGGVKLSPSLTYKGTDLNHVHVKVLCTHRR